MRILILTLPYDIAFMKARIYKSSFFLHTGSVTPLKPWRSPFDKGAFVLNDSIILIID
jgi:hypothetical protein